MQFVVLYTLQVNKKVSFEESRTLQGSLVCVGFLDIFKEGRWVLNCLYNNYFWTPWNVKTFCLQMYIEVLHVSQNKAILHPVQKIEVLNEILHIYNYLASYILYNNKGTCCQKISWTKLSLLFGEVSSDIFYNGVWQKWYPFTSAPLLVISYSF